jgi:oligosaccharide repeat unit polymerase
LIIVSGAILVAKVDVGVNQSFSEMSIVFLRHIAAYALQGPILFSQYIDSNVYVEEHWYPFRSIQHVLSLFNLVEAPEPLNLNFNLYGKEMEGNVYSVYFSVYPWLGVLGSFFTIGLYSLIVTYFYVRSGSGNLIYLLISSFLFSAIVLSMFSDLFLPSFYFILKLSIIILFIKKWFKYRFRT